MAHIIQRNRSFYWQQRLMKFPTRLSNLIFSAEQYRLTLKFKFKTFLRNFKQLIRTQAADVVLGLVIVHDVVTLCATEITEITWIPGHGILLLNFCTYCRQRHDFAAGMACAKAPFNSERSEDLTTKASATQQWKS